jgi:hypothetical protein
MKAAPVIMPRDNSSAASPARAYSSGPIGQGKIIDIN